MCGDNTKRGLDEGLRAFLNVAQIAEPCAIERRLNVGRQGCKHPLEIHRYIDLAILEGKEQPRCLVDYRAADPECRQHHCKQNDEHAGERRLRRFQRALCQKPAVKRLEQDRGERCPQHRLEKRQYDRQQRQRYEREEQQKSALFDLPCFRMIVQDVQRPAIDAVANGDKAAGVRLGLVLNMSRGPASPNSILPVVAH